MLTKYENKNGIFFEIFNKRFQLADFSNYLSICAIVKNEAPYIREWIEYHKLVGIDKFYIFDNESTDNLKEILKEYIDNNIVEYHFIKGSCKQLYCYSLATKKYKLKTYWMAYIDIDEFIVPVNKENISQILENYETAGALGINWCLYGSGKHENKPTGLVIENYKYRANDNFNINKHIKLIANPRKIKKFKTPHFALLKNNFNIINTENEIVNDSLSKKISINKIRINHYFTKSKEEFLLKIDKGKADTKGKRTFADFIYHDKNDFYDNIMDRYIDCLNKREK